MDDTSLDEFVETAEDAHGGSRETAVDDESAADVADAEDGDDPAGSDGTGTVEPATATSRWVPNGTCEDCGTDVSRQWRDDGWVCRDCKEW